MDGEGIWDTLGDAGALEEICQSVTNFRDGFRERHREYTAIDNIDPKLWISSLRPNTHSHI
jgi:hypothetical protein